MKDHERLRQHASRLLALAQRARDEGRHEFGAELSRLAVDAYDQAFAMEGRVRNIAEPHVRELRRKGEPFGN
jgi:hypothetical protein